ncbi:MAG: hypothetical protein IPG54_08385 [Sphingomonadales bacterium]|jgi:hypothetical protein|nr:hypothetical protein [Sphingomonadales bacterium]MBK9004853.1 hypothetical protein [Sphingomonadales bacterium]
MPPQKLNFVADLGLHMGIAAALFVITLLFYGAYYPIHQDLAGSALSGRLSIVLGGAFHNYGIYFPPVEKLWFSLGTRISDATGTRLDLVVVAMAGAAVLFSAALAYYIRRTTVGASPAFLVISVAVLAVLPILFKNVFGLREHIVVAGLWPYLILRVSDPNSKRIGRPLRAILGLWIGFTLLFKYLYSMVVVLVELADAGLQRKPSSLFRTENVVAGSVVFLYLFLWLGLDPVQRATFGAMFSAIDAALVDPTANWIKAAVNMLPAFALLFVSRIFGAPIRDTLLFFAAATGAVIAAWAQERWFSHHLFPIIMIYVMWWWANAKSFRLWANFALGLYLLFSIQTQFRATLEYHDRLDELERAISESGQSVAGKKVALLNAHPSPYNEYIVMHGGLRWTPLMNNAYVAAELKPFDKHENVGKLLPPIKLKEPGRKMLHNQMLQLWEDTPPDVLIVDRTSRWPLRHIAIDWNQALSEDSRFNSILQQYRPVTTYNGRHIRFTYYVRAD